MSLLEVQGAAQADTPELASALQALSSISENLLSSYTTLAARAERIERELYATNEQLEAVLRALPTGVVVHDGQGRIQRANPAACAILGASEAELVAAGSHELLSGRLCAGQTRTIAQQEPQCGQQIGVSFFRRQAPDRENDAHGRRKSKPIA